jgi:hypothetical protein
MEEYRQYRVFVPTTKECHDDWAQDAFRAWEDAGKPPTCIIMKMGNHGWKPISNLNMEEKNDEIRQSASV